MPDSFLSTGRTRQERLRRPADRLRRLLTEPARQEPGTYRKQQEGPARLNGRHDGEMRLGRGEQTTGKGEVIENLQELVKPQPALFAGRISASLIVVGVDWLTVRLAPDKIPFVPSFARRFVLGFLLGLVLRRGGPHAKHRPNNAGASRQGAWPGAC